MIITKQQIIANDMLGHLILHGIASHEDICKKVAKVGTAEVKLTVNGQEIDLQGFVDHWQSQVTEMINKEAAKMVDNKFDKVRDKIWDFTNALDEEINKLAARD